MFVFTIDQIGSRETEDYVPELLEILDGFATLAPFERTIGDEVQGVVDHAMEAYALMMRIIRDGRWHCGLGIGAGDFTHPHRPRTREGRGPAFYAAREAVEKAKGLTPSITLCVPDTDDREAVPACALLRLTAALVADRTERQWQVIDAMRAHGTMTEAAEALGITPSAVSQSLSASRTSLESEAKRGLVYLLEELDTRYSQGSDD